MLKSTYKPPAQVLPLPEGWSEHKAPTGQSYYHNVSTKQSTYTRPSLIQPPAIRYPYEIAGGLPGVHYNGYGQNSHHGTNGSAPGFGGIGHHPFNQSNDYRGRGGGSQRSEQRPQPKDRPKKKYPIPKCPPWMMVKTKLGRRFVYNSEKEESFFKFPPEVMKGVVEYDRLEREKRMRAERGERSDPEDAEKAAAEAELVQAGTGIPTASAAPAPITQEVVRRDLDSDGDEYEEVEVTDDEDDEHRLKRQKTEDGDTEQPVEFNEDDIAYQLAAMGKDYDLDPGEYGDGEGEELEEGAEGLALTEEDANALFKDMLNDYQTSPYTTWEKLIEAGQIIEDDRYTVLSNMRSRKEVWGEWSRDQIQQLKEQRAKEEKQDPRIPYFAFLQSYATPKLYWPEFRRKYKKEQEMRDTKLSDKDREKWYREYMTRKLQYLIPRNQ